MPIRINLLAEAHAAEEMKRRDPVKRAVWVAVFIVFVVSLWASTEVLRARNAKSTQETRENRWDPADPKQKKLSLKQQTADAAEATKKLAEVEKRISALCSLSTNRFLWGSFLNTLQSSMVDQIQLTHIRADERYAHLDPVPQRQIQGKTIPAKLAAAEESITVLIEGRDYGDRSYEKLKLALLSSPFLKPYLPRAEMIKLQAVTPRVAGLAEGGRSYSDFTLLCEFPKTARNE